MFTGLIEATGRIGAFQQTGDDARLYIQTQTLDLRDVKVGDSIAINGVCLTVVELQHDGFWADVSGETLSRTTLSILNIQSEVNLEKALLPTTRLGGHLVSGHVDGVGIIESVYEDGRSLQLKIRTPPELSRYIAQKGSICVDGVSLTVNDAADALFSLNIIPHTQQATTLKSVKVGRQVNLEVDLLARYVERLLTSGVQNVRGDASLGEGLSQATLSRHGFS